MREARVSIREEFSAKVMYRASATGEEIRTQAVIMDISEKGVLFCVAGDGIPEETEVRAAFHLPGLGNETLIQIVGKTKRAKFLEGGRCGIGVEFTEISRENLKSIRSFIANHQLGEAF